eukprot:CAMPEP_0197630332 /NCGR_PEP_ID=MMETSP1338-20131121/7857_1 /TAXON_ID=43686 ORGANISM="Pelagodinium beii, Strain RCC1491" /NCGR_SAMPLE_ID=MMETSP1338 /ASSEMBLY_ACC=CAM_ASM_000754 /LENGTH=135 /DNA_ID=CAMNT_0043201533 /DNA_START=411 /DNA_END=819 /DNA_ORIENTATION=-
MEKTVMKLSFIPSAIRPGEHAETMPLGVFIKGTVVVCLLAQNARKSVCGTTVIIPSTADFHVAEASPAASLSMLRDFAGALEASSLLSSASPDKSRETAATMPKRFSLASEYALLTAVAGSGVQSEPRAGVTEHL